MAFHFCGLDVKHAIKKRKARLHQGFDGRTLPGSVTESAKLDSQVQEKPDASAKPPENQEVVSTNICIPCILIDDMLATTMLLV